MFSYSISSRHLWLFLQDNERLLGEEGEHWIHEPYVELFRPIKEGWKVIWLHGSIRGSLQPNDHTLRRLEHHDTSPCLERKLSLVKSCELGRDQKREHLVWSGEEYD